MEALVKILVGLGFLLLSLGYLYRPGWVLKLNEWGRAAFFNDGFVLLYRRRWGILLFICAILFFYSGFNNLAHQRAHEQPSAYLGLVDAYRAFREKQYKGVVVRCQEVLKQEPDNIHAWTLLGSAWAALGRKDQAKKAWERVLSLDPDSAVGHSPVFLAAPEKDKHP